MGKHNSATGSGIVLVLFILLVIILITSTRSSSLTRRLGAQCFCDALFV
ncbi:hypothetical protein [Chengkuizengella sediminis]|nr:hypothetical protein [Chengkuizengella sediminis]NDI37189.1 hypothetical protein [Chengkuizengella sediminis]